MAENNGDQSLVVIVHCSDNTDEENKTYSIYGPHLRIRLNKNAIPNNDDDAEDDHEDDFFIEE